MWRERENARTELGHPETLLETYAFLTGILFHQRDGERRAAARAKTQRRQVRLRPILGLRHHLVHGRDAAKDGHAFAFDQREYPGGIELPEQNRRSSKDHLRERVDEESAGMEHRKDIQVHVVVGNVVDDGIERVPRDHAVRDLGGFGQTGRPARENQGGNVFRLQ